MIVDTIKSVVANLDQRVTFVYANLFESNFDLDNLASETGWYFVYVPPFENTDRIGTQSEYHTTFTLQAFIVRQTGNETIDFRSEEVQPIVDLAREIGRNFIHKLGEESVIDYDPTYSKGIEEVRYTSEYSWQDIHLFGVSIQATVPIYEAKTGC
jgi:hypothetical protein